jgi:hypothetical protein
MPQLGTQAVLLASQLWPYPRAAEPAKPAAGGAKY